MTSLQVYIAIVATAFATGLLIGVLATLQYMGVI